MDIVKQTLEKFKAILENMSFTDEQAIALQEALAAVNKGTIEEIATLNEEISSLKKQSKAGREVTGYTEEQVEKAMELFEADCEKAAHAMVDDVKQDYAKQLAEGLHDLYEDVEKRVKKEFENSTEFKTLKAVVESVAPLAGASDEASRKELETLRKQLDEVSKQANKLQLSEAINELIADYSGTKKEKLKNYLESAKSVEDVYDRYAAIAEILEEGSEDSRGLNEEATLINEDEEALDEDDLGEDIEDDESEGFDEDEDETEEDEEEEDEDNNFNEDFVRSTGADLKGLSKSQQEALAWLVHTNQGV